MLYLCIYTNYRNTNDIKRIAVIQEAKLFLVVSQIFKDILYTMMYDVHCTYERIDRDSRKVYTFKTLFPSTFVI